MSFQERIEQIRLQDQSTDNIMKEIQDLYDYTVDSDNKNEKFQQLVDCIQQLDDQFYIEQTEQLFELAIKLVILLMHLQIYIQQFNHFFEIILFNNQQASVNTYKLSLYDEFVPQSSDELSLFTLRKLIKICSAKELTLYCDQKLENNKLKTQKQMILASVYLYLIPKLQKKEHFLNKILPNILRILNEAQKKYAKEQQNQNSSDFYQNSQKFLNQYLEQLIPTLMSLPEVKNTKDLLSLNDIYEWKDYQYQLINKNIQNPDKIVKHYVCMFLMDLYEGLNEIKSENFIESHFQKQLSKQIKDAFAQLSPCQLEFLENFQRQQKFMHSFSILSNQNQSYYSQSDSYNSFTIAQIGAQLFKDNIMILYLPQYKIKILLAILNKILQIGQMNNTQDELIQYLKDQFDLIKDKSVSNLYEFDQPLEQFILYLLEFAGNNQLRQEKLYLNLFNIIIQKLTDQSHYDALRKMIDSSSNYSLIAFLVNHLYNHIQLQVKVQGNSLFLNIESIKLLYDEINEKCQKATFTQKIEIYMNLVLLITFLSLSFKNIHQNQSDFNHLLHQDQKQFYIDLIAQSMLIKKEVLEVLNQSSDKKNNSYDLILFHLDRLEEIKFD